MGCYGAYTNGMVKEWGVGGFRVLPPGFDETFAIGVKARCVGRFHNLTDYSDAEYEWECEVFGTVNANFTVHTKEYAINEKLILAHLIGGFSYASMVFSSCGTDDRLLRCTEHRD